MMFSVKRWIAAALCLGAATLSASVRPFELYEYADGRPILIPEVQNYRADAGTLKLPAAFTVALPEGEELVLEQLAGELKRFPEVKVTSGGRDAFCRFILTAEGTPRHDQGYTLAVTGSGITISSRATAGLFYGAQTLRNLIRNAAAPELKRCFITDRPDFDRRGYFFSIRQLKPEHLDRLELTLDTFAALKINWILLELAEAFPYRDNPLTKRKNAFSEADVRRIIEFCRRRHIEICPTLQVWSHAQWMTCHPDWDAMKEGVPARKWYSQPCPYNAAARELTAKAVREHIELFKPRTFLLMLDELFFGPFRSCPKCRATDPVELFSGVIRQYQQQVIDAGVEPMVCHDSFVNNPAYKWTFGDKLRGCLDRRTRILWWNYRDRLPVEELVPFRGFPLAGHGLHAKPFNIYTMAKLIRANGGTDCTMTYWYYSKNGMLSVLDDEAPDSYGGFVIGADFMWRLTDRPHQDYPCDTTLEMMRLIHPEALALPARGATARPLPLDDAVNAELSGTGLFPKLASDADAAKLRKLLAGLPEKFRLITSPGGKYYGLLLTGDKNQKEGVRNGIEFAFQNRKARRISFLLTASRPWNAYSYSARNRGNKTFHYETAARMKIHYADGVTREFPLRYRREITDWNRPFGGFGIRFPFRGVDADRNYFSFGIWDWVNPEPDKPIRAITFATSKLYGIAPALLAASAWETDGDFTPAAAPFRPEMLAKRRGVTFSRNAPAINVRADFEHGMGEVTIEGHEKIRKAVRAEIVDDPASITGDKVLKLTIPPGDYIGRKSDGKFVRVNVDMPCRITKKTRAISVDFKVTCAVPEDFDHANDYLLCDPTPDGKLPHWSFPLQTIQGSWLRNTRAFWVITVVFKDKNLHKKLAKVNKRRVSFFFRRITGPVEIRIDNIGDADEEISSFPLWKEGCEAEPR